MQKTSDRTHRRSWAAGALAMVAILPWASLAFGSQQPGNQKPAVAKNKLGPDLFMAIDRRDLATTQELVKRGADVNARNFLEFTPLYIAAASHQPEAMKALLAAGAKPDAESPYGTPLTFAAMTGHAAGARMLLSKGANPNFARVDGDTALMMAAYSGNPEVVAELLKHGAKVNTASLNGSTALSYAARGGNVEAAKALLKAGAKVDQADADKQTPLMAAAKAGHADFVKLLIKSGAKVNVQNKLGQTPLTLATAYGDSPETVKALVEAGANTQAKDAQGRTAKMWAAKRGNAANAKLLGASMAPVGRSSSVAAVDGLNLLERSMSAFNKGTNCISCHQEGLGRMTTGLARLRGLDVDPKLAKAQAARVAGMLGMMKPLHEKALADTEAMKQIPLIEINEVNSAYGWLLSGMAAQNEAPSPATVAAAKVMARQQSPDGSWTFSLPRIPMQSSVFTSTALAIRSLKAYAPKSDAAEIEAQLDKAKGWLLTKPAKTSDDLAFRLLGLKWAGASIEERQTAIRELLASQRPDGGWSQVPGMRSDAYATGQALYALSAGGDISTSDPAYAKGVQYLLRTQDDDGSWFVNKRAIPANNHYDSAFPHGESQYSSFNATCWATMALLETLPRKK